VEEVQGSLSLFASAFVPKSGASQSDEGQDQTEPKEEHTQRTEGRGFRLLAYLRRDAGPSPRGADTDDSEEDESDSKDEVCEVQ
jgi:hypothetical protein